MANKPSPRKWKDLQVMIATGSMALTLAFWNLFAGPDREAAVKRTQEKAALLPQPSTQTAGQVVEVQPVGPGAALPAGPILLGGTAPQTQIIVQTGGGGGGGAVTSTGSS